MDNYYSVTVKKVRDGVKLANLEVPPELKHLSSELRYPPTCTRDGDAPESASCKSAPVQKDKKGNDDAWSNIGSVMTYPGKLPDTDDISYNLAPTNIATSVSLELIDYPEIRDDMMMMLQTRYNLPVTCMDNDSPPAAGSSKSKK